jgi:ribonuclease VapC
LALSKQAAAGQPMVIDTSALIAFLMNEPGVIGIARAIHQANIRLLSAANFLETSIVIESRKGDAGGRDLELLVYRAAIEIVPVDHGQVEIARVAWRCYGRGRHPAKLNFGDCFAYALSKERQLPLLFIGDDFAKTDIERVLL